MIAISYIQQHQKTCRRNSDRPHIPYDFSTSERAKRGFIPPALTKRQKVEPGRPPSGSPSDSKASNSEYGDSHYGESDSGAGKTEDEDEDKGQGVNVIDPLLGLEREELEGAVRRRDD